MNVTRYINTSSYAGREHYYVAGHLFDYLDYYQTDTTRTMAGLFYDIAWAQVLKQFPNLDRTDFGAEIRALHGLDITFYRRE